MSEAFLSRWSRLKRIPQEQSTDSEPVDLKALAQNQIPSLSQEPEVIDSAFSDEADLDAVADQSLTEHEHEHEHEPGAVPGSESDSEPALLTDEDMPPLDSINARSDVSMFFSSSVSPELRSKALKKLFHQPEFNVRDPLDEYADDYSNMPLLDRKVAATLKGWVGKQVREALLAEENAAAEKADSLAQQREQQSEQQAVDQSAAEDAAQQRQPVECDQIQCDQSPEPEYPNEEEDDQTK